MRRRIKRIRSTLLSLKPKKSKHFVDVFTFVGGPYHGQRAKLSSSLQETSVISCGKCSCKGKYVRGLTQAQENAMKGMPPITVRGFALCWEKA